MALSAMLAIIPHVATPQVEAVAGECCCAESVWHNVQSLAVFSAGMVHAITNGLAMAPTSTRTAISTWAKNRFMKSI
jgi:hypothetical protein